MMEWTQDLPFSRSYLLIVIAVAVAVGALALFGQSSTLALAAAILGLYVLHLFSNWQLASNQRQQWQTLREVERMLDVLDGEGGAHAEAGATPGTGSSPSDADGSLTAVGEERAGAEARKEGPAAADGSGVSAETSGAAASGEPPEDAGPGEGRDHHGESDAAEREDDGDGDTVLVPRQFKLGTVAVVERVLTPGEVARVLAVQDRHPDRQFGDIARELDVLSEAELQDLLETQKAGLYRPEAISRARRDLKEFRREKAVELGTGP